MYRLFQLCNARLVLVDFRHLFVFFLRGLFQTANFFLCIRQIAGQILVLVKILGNLRAQIFRALDCLYIVICNIAGCQQHCLQRAGTAFFDLAHAVVHERCDLGHIFLILLAGHGKPVAGNDDLDSVFHRNPLPPIVRSHGFAFYSAGEFLHMVVL